MFEKGLSTSFLDLQVNLLIPLVDVVDLVRVVSCRWILFLERYMKNLKGFIQQREKLEGSIVEGYIVYESFFHASEYIKKTNTHLGIVVWDNQ